MTQGKQSCVLGGERICGIQDYVVIYYVIINFFNLRKQRIYIDCYDNILFEEAMIGTDELRVHIVF